MGRVLTRNTIAGFKEEVTEGTYNAPLAGDVVQLADVPNAAPVIDKIDRTIIKGSLSQLKPLAGMHSGTIEAMTEIRAAGVTANVSDQPEAHVLFKNALGRYNAGTNATTVAGSTASAINLGVGEGATFAVHDVVFILGEVRHVISIAVDTITLNAPLDAGAPAAATAVRAGHNYKPGTGATPYTSLTASLWQDAEVTGPEFRGLGCKVASLSLDGWEVGAIPKASWSLEMLDHSEVIGTSPASPIFEDQLPAVAIYGLASRADVAIPVGKLELEIANTISRERDLNTPGGNVRMFITGREVTGNIDPLFEQANVDLQTAWRNNDSFEMQFVVGIRSGALLVQGSCTSIYMPNVIFTTSEREDQDGLLKHSLGFKAHESVSGTGDDEIVVSFV